MYTRRSSINVTEVVVGTPALAGDFDVSFAGAVTQHIPVTATAFEMARALELMPTVGAVNVTVIPLANGGSSWVVTFQNNLGNLPLMTVTQGRLNGTNPIAYVVKTQQVCAVCVYMCMCLPVCLLILVSLSHCRAHRRL